MQFVNIMAADNLNQGNEKNYDSFHFPINNKLVLKSEDRMGIH